MNKKYIDFVPKATAKQEIVLPEKPKAVEPLVSEHAPSLTDITRVKSRKVAARPVSLKREKLPPEPEMLDFDDLVVENPVEKSVENPVENFGFLSGRRKSDRKSEKRPEKRSEKKPESRPEPIESPKSDAKSDDKTLSSAVKAADNLDRKLKIPKVNFVNTEKVAKRPLSKNVYQKKIETPKEEPQGPVTIIAKPEKDSKVGLIVTIIITVILGAAAGTVAFLLLPK